MRRALLGFILIAFILSGCSQQNMNYTTAVTPEPTQEEPIWNEVGDIQRYIEPGDQVSWHLNKGEYRVDFSSDVEVNLGIWDGSTWLVNKKDIKKYDNQFKINEAGVIKIDRKEPDPVDDPKKTPEPIPGANIHLKIDSMGYSGNFNLVITPTKTDINSNIDLKIEDSVATLSRTIPDNVIKITHKGGDQLSSPLMKITISYKDGDLIDTLVYDTKTDTFKGEQSKLSSTVMFPKDRTFSPGETIIIKENSGFDLNPGEILSISVLDTKTDTLVISDYVQIW